MSRSHEPMHPGIVEIGLQGVGRGGGLEEPPRRGGLPEWPRAQVVAAPPATWRLVGCEAKPPRETPRLGHWGRSIARSENRRMEHLARMLGLRASGFGSDLPPAA